MLSRANSDNKICGFLYAILFALSIVLINPFVAVLKPHANMFPDFRYLTWGQPKVLMVMVITIANLACVYPAIRKHGTEQTVSALRRHRLFLLFFLGYVLIGGAATLFSPLPQISLHGQVTMADGLYYWILIFLFFISNLLCISMNPRLAGYQIAGILAGCCILALSIYPQVIDWTIDYTCVGGRKFTDKILLSTIWKGQMPIGLYSHRGHAGFPLLAGIGALLFVYKNGLITKNRFFIINTLLFNALFFLRTRGVTLAALCSVVLFYYQFTKQQREFQRKMVITLLISIITAYGVYKTALNTMPLFLRKTPDLFSKNWDSSRMELWRTGIRAIMYRPLIGWGYDGYAIAAPYFENGSEAPVHIIKCRAMKYNGITRRVCITPSNERIEQKFMSAKAHNIAIDIALSLGVPGLFVFITLSFFALRYSCKGEFKEMILVFQLFLVYGLTWFECSQYGHVYWWALSIVLGGCDKNAFTAAVAPSETLSSIKSSTA